MANNCRQFYIQILTNSQLEGVCFALIVFEFLAAIIEWPTLFEIMKIVSSLQWLIYLYLEKTSFKLVYTSSNKPLIEYLDTFDTLQDLFLWQEYSKVYNLLDQYCIHNISPWVLYLQ